MNESPKQRWGCVEWGIVVVVVMLLISLIIPAFNRIPEMGRQTRTMQNGRSIILVLMQYSKDFGSNYPSELLVDAKSSNQVFRELFKEELVTDERVFECTASIFNADKNIGSAPSFEKALMPGECHWMLMKGQMALAHPKMPVIIENSLNTDWPPKWDVAPSERLRKRGQAWPGRKIIIGRNDGSVAVEKLRPDGTLDWYSAPNLGPDGKSWIDSLTPEQIAKLAYWDIEEK